MPELVTIPISFFEIAFEYEKPEIKLLGDRAPLLEALFDALAPYKPVLDDVDVLTAGKISEQGLLIKLSQKQISFFVGATICRFQRNAIDWNLADETITILDLLVSTLARFTGATMSGRRTVMGMHIQPKRLSFRDILRPFIPSQFAALQADPYTTMANVTKWANRAVTIDGSGTLANALFLKLERTFPAMARYEEMAQQLQMDELELFAILDIEEDRP